MGGNGPGASGLGVDEFDGVADRGLRYWKGGLLGGSGGGIGFGAGKGETGEEGVCGEFLSELVWYAENPASPVAEVGASDSSLE